MKKKKNIRQLYQSSHFHLEWYNFNIILFGDDLKINNNNIISIHFDLCFSLLKGVKC